MARKGGKDRGLVEKPKGSGRWYVRLCTAGREKMYRCDSKSQAKALYGRLKADIREETYFPEKFAVKHDSDAAQAMLRSLDSFVRSPWVFPSAKHPLQPQNPQSFVNNVYSVALRKAGITGANWHSLRHTAASRRIMSGVDLVSVTEILGHRDIQTTLRYSHLAPAHLGML